MGNKQRPVQMRVHILIVLVFCIATSLSGYSHAVLAEISYTSAQYKEQTSDTVIAAASLLNFAQAAL